LRTTFKNSVPDVAEGEFAGARTGSDKNAKPAVRQRVRKLRSRRRLLPMKLLVLIAVLVLLRRRRTKLDLKIEI
jgi:hypothetical protein